MTTLNKAYVIVNTTELVNKTLASIPAVHDGISIHNQLVVVGRDYDIEPKFENEVTFLKGQATQVEDKVTQAPTHRFYRTLDNMGIGEYVTKAKIRSKVYIEEIVAQKVGNDSWLLINRSTFEYESKEYHEFIKDIAKQIFDESDCANRSLHLFICLSTNFLQLVDFDGEDYITAWRDELNRVRWSRADLRGSELVFTGNQDDFLVLFKRHLN